MSASFMQSPAREIHSTALVSPRAQIGTDCCIGPYSIIGDEVSLGDRVRIDSHCVIDGLTRIGDETHIYPFVSIGLPPQDLKFAGEATETEIGRRNRIREFVTIHRGTDRKSTRLNSSHLVISYAVFCLKKKKKKRKSGNVIDVSEQIV